MADTSSKTDEMEESVEYVPPAYATDEKKEGFVKVIVAAKHLSTSREIVRKGLLPKTVKRPSNAKVNVVFENQAFCATIRGEKGDMKGKNLQLNIKRLPHEIDSDKSYYEVDDDRILVFLCKRQDRSWYPELNNGLETAEEEEETVEKDE